MSKKKEKLQKFVFPDYWEIEAIDLVSAQKIYLSKK